MLCCVHHPRDNRSLEDYKLCRWTLSSADADAPDPAPCLLRVEFLNITQMGIFLLH